jgi:3-methyladenine DNA glycosylase AlkD
MSYREVKKELQKLSNPKQAKLLQRFFKTGKGEYGEGDVFLGIKVGPQRSVAKKYATVISISETEKLLHSKIHEYRLVALLILMNKYKKADEKTKKKIYKMYLDNTKYINNWDLVDLSAAYIVGDYLANNKQEKKILRALAKSKMLWERRIAVISTFYFIKQYEFGDALRIAEMLVHDKHDIIHKAVGWMLREVGKKNQAAEERFLKRHYKQMPRTMLRYAIERFDEKKRKFYMKK